MKATRTALGAAAGLLAACLLTVPAAAQDIRTDLIASGERDRPYHTYGTRMVNMLKAFRLRNQITTGSVENLELLADGRATLGFVQADVYGLGRLRNAARYDGLTLVGHLVDECVFIAARRDGPIPDLAALGRPVDGVPARVAVGDAGSGMAATWQFLATLDPALASAQVVQRGGVLAVNQVSLRQLHAVAWVNDPRDLGHAMLRAVLESPELRLLPMGEKFTLALENGTVVYELRELPLTSRARAGDPTLRTVCTKAGVFAREGADPVLVEAVSRLLRFEREALVRQDGS